MTSTFPRDLRASGESTVGPSLAEGENVQREGVAAVTRGLFGGRWGPLILTNRRLFWSEKSRTWPFERQSRDLPLAEIVGVDKGSIVDWIFGGRRIRIKLRNGRIVKFFEGQGKLDAWISNLNDQIN
jgi:hypothetical protein